MKVRFKIFSEFMRDITVAYRQNGGGVKIVCNIGERFVMVESKFPLWNSPSTRRGFLVKLYLREVHEKKNLDKRIERIPGFALLGKRAMYRDSIVIICNSEDLVDESTGEMTQRLTVFDDWISHPFKVPLQNVQL